VLPLVTLRLELRDFRLEDLAAVHAYGSDPLVTRYTSWGPNTEAETREFLERAVAGARETPREAYELAIVLRDAGRLIGGTGVYRRAERQYELGYCLHRDAWGRGLATEAARAMVGLAFGALRAHRVYARIDPDNVASVRAIEKLGFRCEGRHRRDMLKNGVWRDTHFYAALEEEWASRSDER
jgi:RimJ/RimL family protein N-acetyltransferase